MLGLVYATWEKYVAERFGSNILELYRSAISENIGRSPLANRLYDDESFAQGLRVVSRQTNILPDILLREFGRHFINDGLTRHLCSYLLSQTFCARDLVLLMRQAHLHMDAGPDGLTPPLFSYQFLTEDRNHILFTYESPRHFCGWFWGAVEGAAARYNEAVYIVEQTCCKQGFDACRFEVYFQPFSAQRNMRTPEQQARWMAQQRLAEMVLAALPDVESSLTLFDLQDKLRVVHHATPQQLRPGVLLEILQMLHYAGLVATTANQPGDDLSRRRYWRVHVHA